MIIANYILDKIQTILMKFLNLMIVCKVKSIMIGISFTTIKNKILLNSEVQLMAKLSKLKRPL